MPKRSAVHHVINTARKQLKMSEQDLWVAYEGRGGSVSQPTISAFLRGVMTLSEQDINRLAIALNERFTGENRDLPARRVEVTEAE